MCVCFLNSWAGADSKADIHKLDQCSAVQGLFPHVSGIFMFSSVSLIRTMRNLLLCLCCNCCCQRQFCSLTSHEVIFVNWSLRKWNKEQTERTLTIVHVSGVGWLEPSCRLAESLISEVRCSQAAHITPPGKRLGALSKNSARAKRNSTSCESGLLSINSVCTLESALPNLPSVALAEPFDNKQLPLWWPG